MCQLQCIYAVAYSSLYLKVNAERSETDISAELFQVFSHLLEPIQRKYYHNVVFVLGKS